MKRIGFIALSLCCFLLAACAISEPNPAKDQKNEREADSGDNNDLKDFKGSNDNPVVVMETSKGTVKMVLYQDKAPISVKNFLKYVDKKHYDGTIFHRVMVDFMIQGGGMEPNMREKPGDPPIKNEAYNRLPNDRGTLAMARTSVPDSATAQFYINVKHNPDLNRKNARDGVGYAVFGRVIDGMNVVDEIRQVRTGNGDVPIETVLIKSIRRVEPKADANPDAK